MVCCLDLSTTVEISPRAGLGVRFARLRTKGSGRAVRRGRRTLLYDLLLTLHQEMGVGGKNKPPSEREVSRFTETEGAYESIRFCVLPVGNDVLDVPIQQSLSHLQRQLPLHKGALCIFNFVFFFIYLTIPLLGFAFSLSLALQASSLPEGAFALRP